MSELQSPSAQISNSLVRLHKEYYGKGPTKAKTYIHDDLVLCILQGGLTTVEQTLIDSGQEDAVRAIRHAFQRAMRERFVGTIEDSTGQTVIAYMSQIHTDPDVSAEIFVLDPIFPSYEPEPDGRKESL